MHFSPMRTSGYKPLTTTTSSSATTSLIFTVAFMSPLEDITLPTGAINELLFGTISFPSSVASVQLIKLLLAPVSTMAQQRWSSTSCGTSNLEPLKNFPAAIACGASM